MTFITAPVPTVSDLAHHLYNTQIIHTWNWGLKGYPWGHTPPHLLVGASQILDVFFYIFHPLETIIFAQKPKSKIEKDMPCFVLFIYHHNELKLQKKNPFQFQICVWMVAYMITSTFLEIFSPLQVSFGDPLPESISKNVDFGLLGQQCIVLPQWTFFRVLAYCAEVGGVCSS